MIFSGKIPVSSFLVLLFTVASKAQPWVLKGTVTDARTKAPLAFVSVVADDEKKGTVTDIDGKFFLQLPVPPDSVRFSYVGYQPLVIPVSSFGDRQNAGVEMERKSVELREVTVLPGENPAHRLIRTAISQKEKNDPERMKSFRCRIYHKFVFTALADSFTANSQDTLEQKARSFFEKSHLLLMESVTEKKFLYPGLVKERILASRVSGLKETPLVLLATELQSFSVYKDYFRLSEKSYLSPLAKGSTARYLYVLEDTLWSGPDTVFVISYRPQKGKNFTGLEGLLYINSNGYAVQNFIAAPAGQEGLYIKVQQKFEQIGGKQWFPVQLNTEIIPTQVKVNSWPLAGIGRSYISHIELDPGLEKKEFDYVEVELAGDVLSKDSVFWSQNRADSLSQQELNTYRIIDSLGKAVHLERQMRFLEALVRGRLPLGYVEADLDKLIGYNRWEGLRAGLGLHTGSKVSSVFSAGGFAAWGFKDKELKYGADAEAVAWKKKEWKAVYIYMNDREEAGGVNFTWEKRKLGGEGFRDLLVNYMDKTEKHELFFRWRMMSYWQVKLSGRLSHITALNAYQYATLSDFPGFRNTFRVLEAGIVCRYAFRERVMESHLGNIPAGTVYPVVWMGLSKGLRGATGEFDYVKAEVRVTDDFKTRNAGVFRYVLAGGYITPHVPMHWLFNGNGSFGQFSLMADYTFQAVLPQEFFHDRFAYLYLSHDFGALLFRSGSFKPEIVLLHHMGWGNLQYPLHHFNVPLKTMENGYFESGLAVNNVLRSGFSGLGMAALYRYGTYKAQQFSHNLALKITMKLNF